MQKVCKEILEMQFRNYVLNEYDDAQINSKLCDSCLARDRMYLKIALLPLNKVQTLAYVRI